MREIVNLEMNLVQMLVLQLENRSTCVLAHALLLSHFCFGSTYSFLFGLRYRRSSFFHFLVIETMGMGLCTYVVTDDLDLAKAFNEAYQRQEEG